MQRKREEKRQENKEKAEEEVRYLQATGKVGKNPAHKTNNMKKEGGGARKRVNSDKEDQGTENEDKSTPSSARNIDDFFQVGLL